MHFDPVNLIVPPREERDAWSEDKREAFRCAFEERLRMEQTLKVEIKDAVDGKLLFIEHVPTGERVAVNCCSSDPDIIKVLYSVRNAILTLQNAIACGGHGSLLKATYDARTNLDDPVRPW